MFTTLSYKKHLINFRIMKTVKLEIIQSEGAYKTTNKSSHSF